MRRKGLDKLLKLVDALGMDFQECNYAYHEPHPGCVWFNGCGCLREKDRSPLTTERLALLLKIAEENKTYVIILPEKQKVRKFGVKPDVWIPLQENELAVCFVSKELLQTIRVAVVPIMVSLKRNFLYYQEDEKILAMEAKLDRLLDAMQAFEADAYDVRWLKSNPSALRVFLQDEGEFFRQGEELDGYMENSAYRSRVDVLCEAGLALRLIE